MARTATRHLTVRLPRDTRRRLNIIARDTDRTLAQLVRYALVSFFDQPPASLPLEDGERSQHLGVRIPVDLADQVAAYAAARKATPSDVIRYAIDRWLASDPTAALGRPHVEGR